MSDLFVSLLVVVMTLFGFACGVVWAARRMITRHTPEWTAKCKEIQDALNDQAPTAKPVEASGSGHWGKS